METRTGETAVRDVRYGAPLAAVVARLHRRRGGDAGARHRRQHGHLQRRQRRAAPGPAVSRARSAGARVGELHCASVVRRAREVSPGGLCGLARPATGRSPAWAAYGVDNYSLTGAGDPDQDSPESRDDGANLFTVLGMQPLLGRTLTPGRRPARRRACRGHRRAHVAFAIRRGTRRWGRTAHSPERACRIPWWASCRPTSDSPTRRPRCGCPAKFTPTELELRAGYFLYVRGAFEAGSEPRAGASGHRRGWRRRLRR